MPTQGPKTQSATVSERPCINSTPTNFPDRNPDSATDAIGMIICLDVFTMEGGRRTDLLLCGPPSLGLERSAKLLPRSDTSLASIRGVAWK